MLCAVFGRRGSGSENDSAEREDAERASQDTERVGIGERAAALAARQEEARREAVAWLCFDTRPEP